MLFNPCGVEITEQDLISFCNLFIYQPLAIHQCIKYMY
jgi:hypothetical protein